MTLSAFLIFLNISCNIQPSVAFKPNLDILFLRITFEDIT